MPKICGPLKNRVDKCTSISDMNECQGLEDDVAGGWYVDKGKPYLCQWKGHDGNEEGKCVNGTTPCDCRRAPFQLELIGLGKNAPVNCEDIDVENCIYFQNFDGRRCVINEMRRKCQAPSKADPVCTEPAMDAHMYAQNDCDDIGVGDFKWCVPVCKAKDPQLTGDPTELLQYDCALEGAGGFCKCTYPKIG